MSSDARDFSRLTLKHGCKCIPDAQVSVEDCLIAVSLAIGGTNIKSASRMNKAIVFFLSESQMVDNLIESGLIIKDAFVPVLPLSSPSKKVVLSNVPPFVKNEKLDQILQKYGKIVSPIKMIPLGCKNPEIKHVMSFRRQTFMILNSPNDPLNLSVKLSIDGKDYTIFITSDSMKCFVCGGFNHVRQSCPNRDRPVAAPAAPTADAENSEEALGTEVVSAAGASEPRPGEATEVPGDLPDNPVLVASKDGLEGAPEEVAGPSNAVPQAETSLEQICLEKASEIDPLCFDKQTDADKTESDINDTLDQSQDDISSQDFADLNVQMDCSDKEDEDDATLMEPKMMDLRPTSGGKTKLYSVQQINNFLDFTKGLRKPKIESYFPDLKLFLLSVTMAMRKASIYELDKPKRYRLRKLMGNVRSTLNGQD